MRSDQVFDDMMQSIVAYIHENGNETGVILLKPVLRYFYVHSEIIELLIKAGRLNIAMASFHRAVAPFVPRAKEYYDNIPDEYIKYGITLRIGMITNILVQWIETGKQQPPDELAEKLSGMLKDMVTLDQLL